MTDLNKPLGVHVPVLSGKNEANEGNLMIFTPVMKCTGVRFMLGFTKPYTPSDPPPDSPDGGTTMTGNVVAFKKVTNVSNNNQRTSHQYRKVA